MSLVQKSADAGGYKVGEIRWKPQWGGKIAFEYTRSKTWSMNPSSARFIISLQRTSEALPEASGRFLLVD